MSTLVRSKCPCRVLLEQCSHVILLTKHVIFLLTSGKDDDEFVTCGSAIKLSHYESKAQTKTEHFLNSEGKNLGSGSGQQIVTSVPDPSTTNALWWVRGPNVVDGRSDEISACKSGEPAELIPCGSIMRLTHLNSMKNLHSHDVRSPLSRQQEVTAYGQGDGIGDNGDDWRLICSTGHWKREELVQFQHVDSKRYLGASSTVKASLNTRNFAACELYGTAALTTHTNQSALYSSLIKTAVTTVPF